MNPTRLKPMLSLGIVSFVTLVSFGTSFLYQLPDLQSRRKKLDDTRTKILALEYQAANVESVRRDLSDVEQYQTQLDSYVWSFTSEEGFYTQWETFDRTQAAKTNTLSLSDAVPTGDLLIRTGSVVISGSPDETLTAIQALQKIKPLIGITAIHLLSPSSRHVDATVTFSTAWR